MYIPTTTTINVCLTGGTRQTRCSARCSAGGGGVNTRARLPGNLQTAPSPASSLTGSQRISWVCSQSQTNSLITLMFSAMSRPNTAQIESCDLLGQFSRHRVRSIVNLQQPGEHASCGPRLEQSGFTYDPNLFMKHKELYTMINIIWVGA